MLPNAKGYFGKYGGRFVPETLVPRNWPGPTRRLPVTRFSGQSWPGFPGTMRDGPRRSISPPGSRKKRAERVSSSSGRTWPTPGRTR
jgi:hypothetical protein